MSKSRLPFYSLLAALLALAGWFAYPVFADTRSKGVHVLYASGAAVTGGNNILTTALTPSLKASVLRASFILPTTSVMSVVLSDGSTITSAELNGGTALTADTYYTFDIQVTAGLTYNFSPATNQAGIDLLLVHEVEE